MDMDQRIARLYHVALAHIKLGDTSGKLARDSDTGSVGHPFDHIVGVAQTQKSYNRQSNDGEHQHCQSAHQEA